MSHINVKHISIGNYFEDKLSGELLLVDEIVKDDNGKHVIGFYVVNRDKYPLPAGWQAVPIQLSYRILEMFGFVSEDDSLNLFKKGDFVVNFHIHNGTIDYCGERIIDTGGDEMLSDVCPFHRLQNIYSALTGEELNRL